MCVEIIVSLLTEVSKTFICGLVWVEEKLFQIKEAVIENTKWLKGGTKKRAINK